MSVEARLKAVEGRLDEIHAMLRRVALSVVRLQPEAVDARADSPDAPTTRSEFIGRTEKLAALIDDMRYDWAKNRARLDDQERRLARLESKQG